MIKVEAIQNGGTHGSPVDPLLHVVDVSAVLGLPPGKARLRPRIGSDRTCAKGDIR
jgi:hypothetical protein